MSNFFIIKFQVASDFIYLICFNGVGIYFRYLNEINARISFLDRRQFILSTYQLRDERAQVVSNDY